MGFTFTDNSATIGTTEWYLPSNSSSATPQSADCYLQVWLGLANLAAGDQFRLKIYEQVNGTNTLAHEATFTGLQSQSYVAPILLVGDGWDVSLTKIAGTDRSIKWSLRKDTLDVNVASVTAGAINSTAFANPDSNARYFRDEMRGWMWSGTAQSGSTANTIKLDANASAVDGTYVGCRVQTIRDSDAVFTASGQTRTIIAYNGSTKVATVDRCWTTTPDTSTRFAVLPHTHGQIVFGCTAAAATSTTVTLTSVASANTDAYNGTVLWVVNGTGAGQVNRVRAYNGTTKVATLAKTFATTPSTDSEVILLTDSSFFEDSSLTATAIASSAITNAKFAANAIDSSALATSAVTEITDAILALVYEGSRTFKDYLRLSASALLHKAAGFGTSTRTFRDSADTKDRITATVDATGRTAVTLDAT